jgi:hypothetical protein
MSAYWPMLRAVKKKIVNLVLGSIEKELFTMSETSPVTRENLQMLESELVMLEHDIARLVKKAKGSEVQPPFDEQINSFMQDNPLLIERLAELVVIKAIVNIFRRLQPQ